MVAGGPAPAPDQAPASRLAAGPGRLSRWRLFAAQPEGLADSGNARNVGEGEAEDHFVRAGVDMTGDQAGDLMRLTDGEPGDLFCGGGSRQHLAYFGGVLVRGSQDQRSHPGPPDLGRVAADVGAVPAKHVDLASQRGDVAGDVALVGVLSYQPQRALLAA